MVEKNCVAGLQRQDKTSPVDHLGERFSSLLARKKVSFSLFNRVRVNGLERGIAGTLGYGKMKNTLSAG